MLDVRLELQSYQPVEIKEIEEEAGKLPENIEEAINLYNKAVDDAKTGSEDIAIIALKKALSLHPGFYEAMNLLGLCYSAIGKEDMAEFAFKQVIEADDSGVRALKYLKKLKGTTEHEEFDSTAVRRSSKSREDRKKSKKSGEPGLFASWLAKGLQKEDNNIYGLKYVAGIFMGVFIMALIWYMVPTNKSLFTIRRVENIIKNEELENQIEQQNIRIEKLEQELKNRKEEYQELVNSFEEYKLWVQRLDEAQTEYRDGNILRAADLLYNAQKEIPNDLKYRHMELWNQVRLEAAEQLYHEGSSIYNGNRTMDPQIYKQALDKFEAAMIYVQQDQVTYLAPMYYLAGKAAARCNELERAVALFEAIVDNFPNSQYSSYSQVRLREIREGKPITGN